MKELKDLIALLAQGVKSGLAIGKDGKIDMQDIPAVFAFAQKIPAALAGVGQVPAELSHLSSEQAADVIAFTMAELALDESKAKHVVEASLKIAVDVLALVEAIKAPAPAAAPVAEAAAAPQA